MAVRGLLKDYYRGKHVHKVDAFTVEMCGDRSDPESEAQRMCRG